MIQFEIKLFLKPQFMFSINFSLFKELVDQRRFDIHVNEDFSITVLKINSKIIVILRIALKLYVSLTSMFTIPILVSELKISSILVVVLMYIPEFHQTGLAPTFCICGEKFLKIDNFLTFCVWKFSFTFFGVDHVGGGSEITKFSGFVETSHARRGRLARKGSQQMSQNQKASELPYQPPTSKPASGGQFVIKPFTKTKQPTSHP